MKVIVDKDYIKTMFGVCGIEELEIIVPILKERINKMLKGVVELIEMFETDKELKNFLKPLEFWYGTKKRIEDLLKIEKI